MLIRPMQQADVEVAVDLAQANYDGVLAEYHSAEVLAELRADLTAESLREQMTWKRIFVVEDAGRLVAMGALADYGSPGAPKPTVSQFYVDTAIQGRGVGRLLLDHLIEVACDAGVDALHVPSSRNAIGFYERAGFAIDTVQPDAALEITWMTTWPAKARGTSASS